MPGLLFANPFELSVLLSRFKTGLTADRVASPHCRSVVVFFIDKDSPMTSWAFDQSFMMFFSSLNTIYRRVFPIKVWWLRFSFYMEWVVFFKQIWTQNKTHTQSVTLAAIDRFRIQTQNVTPRSKRHTVRWKITLKQHRTGTADECYSSYRIFTPDSIPHKLSLSLCLADKTRMKQ